MSQLAAARAGDNATSNPTAFASVLSILVVLAVEAGPHDGQNKYGNFDIIIIVDSLFRAGFFWVVLGAQLDAASHAPCDILNVVPMPIGC